MIKTFTDEQIEALTERMREVIHDAGGKTGAERAKDAITLMIATKEFEPPDLFDAVSTVCSVLLGRTVVVSVADELDQGRKLDS